MTVTKLKHVVLKAFYSRWAEEELESNVEIFELLVVTTKVAEMVDCVWDDSNAKSGP